MRLGLRQPWECVYKYTLQQLAFGVLHCGDVRAINHENDYTIILFSRGLQITLKIA